MPSVIVGAQRLSLAKLLKAAGHCRGRSWRQVSLTEVGQAIKCSCSFPNGEPNCEIREPLAHIAVSVAAFLRHAPDTRNMHVSKRQTTSTRRW